MKNIALAIITARKGSKGIPHKNKKLLGGIPLVAWSIAQAKRIVPANQICVSTDDDDILDIAREMGCPAPFKRPDELSQDRTGSYEVILHAINNCLGFGYGGGAERLFYYSSRHLRSGPIARSMRQ